MGIPQWNGETYRVNNAPQNKWNKNIFEKIKVNGNENILDIGCGDGAYVEKLAKQLKTGKVIGIDPSESMIKAARKYHKELQFEHRSHKEIMEKNTYDIILSFYVLHWIKDKNEFLKRAYNALKNGGKLYLVFGGIKGQESQIVKTIAKVANKFGEKISRIGTGEHLIDQNDFKEMVIINNFKICELDVVTKYAKFNSHKEMFDWIYNALPHKVHLNDEQTTEFINEVIKEHGDLSTKSFGIDAILQK